MDVEFFFLSKILVFSSNPSRNAICQQKEKNKFGKSKNFSKYFFYDLRGKNINESIVLKSGLPEVGLKKK
jgi:hypothetical protein